MGKVALKSVLYSLLCCVLLFVICFGLSCLIAPIKVADFVVQLNMNKFSTVLTISEYKRSKDINDLALVVERSTVAKMHGETVTYAKLLMDDPNYADFTKWKDQGLTGYSYDNFITSNYVYAVFKESGESEELFSFATERVDRTANSYPVNNAVTRYIDAAAESKNRVSLRSAEVYLLAKYDALKASEGVSKSAKRLVCFDLYRVYTYEGNAEQASVWEAAYNEYL